jgi:hypothetical protein
VAHSDPPITVVALVPERRRQRVSVPAQAGGCCCCCCCCLHTIRGIVGAAVAPHLGYGYHADSPHPLTDFWNDREVGAPAPPTPVTNPEAITSSPPTPHPAPDPSEDSSADRERTATLIVRRSSAVSLFWWTVLAIGVVSSVLSLLYYKEIGVPIAILVLGLPAVQLAALIVTAVILGVSERPDKEFQFRLLGKIFLGWFIGTFVGAVGTVAVFYLIVR